MCGSVRRWRRSALGGLACALVLLRSATGSAEVVDSDALALDWEAPEQCAGANAVLGKVRTLLGGAAVAPEKKLGVQARVTHGEAGWRLELHTERGESRGQRILTAETCTELVDAGALSLAMAIDPALVDAARQARSDAEPRPGAPASEPSSLVALPLPATLPAADAPPPKAPPTRFVVGAAAALDVGSLPSPALGPRLVLGVWLPRWRFEASASWWPFSRGQVDAPEPRGGDFRLLSAGLGSCYLLAEKSVVLGGCAGAEAGTLTGEGFGVSDPGESSEPWLAIIARALVAWPARGPVALRASLGALAPITRTEYVLEGLDVVVHQAAPVAARGDLGVEFRF